MCEINVRHLKKAQQQLENRNHSGREISAAVRLIKKLIKQKSKLHPDQAATFKRKMFKLNVSYT